MNDGILLRRNLLRACQSARVEVKIFVIKWQNYLFKMNTQLYQRGWSRCSFRWRLVKLKLKGEGNFLSIPTGDADILWLDIHLSGDNSFLSFGADENEEIKYGWMSVSIILLLFIFIFYLLSFSFLLTYVIIQINHHVRLEFFRQKGEYVKKQCRMKRERKDRWG